MNSRRIEEIAIDAIRKQILRSEYLANEIPVNDKTPSWDGEIWVYNSSKQTKDKLFGKVPIQVKGKKVNKLSNKVKFPITKVDLENYYQNGGVIFFVVEIVSIEETKISYLNLLPIDLKGILTELNGKKSITKTFNKLGNGNREFEFICRNFIYHSRKQGLPLLKDNKINYDNINMKIFAPSQEDIENYLFEHGTYAYGHIKELNLDIPLYKMEIQTLEEEADLWVGVNEEKCYLNTKRVINKDKVFLKFGKSFELILSKNLSNEKKAIYKVKLNFTEKGTIQERIKDLKFLIKIISNKSININGSIIALDNFEGKYDILCLLNHLQTLVDIVTTFKTLNISFNEDPDILNTDDWNTIDSLVHIILNKEYNLIKKKVDNRFLHFRIGNLKLVLFTATVHDELMVYNLFNFDIISNYLEVYITLETDNAHRVKHSPYLLFDTSYLLEICNFDYHVVEKSFKSVDYTYNICSTSTNDYMLRILNYYDKHTHRRELLTMILNIFEHLEITQQDNLLNYLNKMQVIKRIREFTKEEKVILLERKLEHAHTTELLCAFSILLDSKIEFEVNFNKLTTEERNRFQTYPIFNLVENWNQVSETP
ncbi:hypothetical protein FZW96_11110 [Bacillus sp. BGMRC 2118]|nr:hypothetical protein FZW96_11110 [Bacillus sp. BGMRC 2118]